MEFLSALAVGLVASLAATPLCRIWARQIRLTDRPDSQRKLHERAVPLGGGIAVLFAAIVAVTAILLMGGDAAQTILKAAIKYQTMLAAAVVICIVGLLDDWRGIRGRQKLAGQILAVTIMMFCGMTISRIQVFDWRIDLGLLAVPFTMLWMLGATNSLNLLDGADGFATTIGIIISGTIGIMAMIGGHPDVAVIALALTGALVGFLVFNFPPASVFLGDAGSMLIGFCVGVLSIEAALKGPATVALVAPLAILALPFFDSSVAIMRRWLTGRSIYSPDRGHLHHSLARHGFGPRGLVACVGILSSVTAAGVLAGLFLRNELLAMISTFSAIGILVASRVFGFKELALLASRILAFANSLVNSATYNEQAIHQESVKLQGSRNWDQLWDSVTEFADCHDLCRVRLDLNAAWLHEGFHAKWQKGDTPEKSDTWYARFPLAANGKTFGRLELSGVATMNRSNYTTLSALAELMDALQPVIEGLSEELPSDPVDEFATPKVEFALESAQPLNTGR